MPYLRWADAKGGDVVGVKYWNGNGRAVAIVAVRGYADDWAAYVGADDGEREADCIEWTIHNGAKLSHTDAVALFPTLPTEAWRS